MKHPRKNIDGVNNFAQGFMQYGSVKYPFKRMFRVDLWLNYLVKDLFPTTFYCIGIVFEVHFYRQTYFN